MTGVGVSRLERARQAAVALARGDHENAAFKTRTAFEIGDEVDRVTGMRLDWDETAEAVEAYDDQLNEFGCWRNSA